MIEFTLKVLQKEKNKYTIFMLQNIGLFRVNVKS